MRIAILELYESDAILRGALGNRSISLCSWICPKRSLERNMVSEFSCFIKTHDPILLGNVTNDSRFPTMKALRTHVYYGKMNGGYEDVLTPPCAFDFEAMAPIALKVLARKRNKASGYSGHRLCWSCPLRI